MNWNDLVRKHFPEADDEFCEFVLWEHTPFPVVQDVERIEELIIKLKNKKENKSENQ
jgi:predicted nucleotidyltransferase